MQNTIFARRDLTQAEWVETHLVYYTILMWVSSYAMLSIQQHSGEMFFDPIVVTRLQLHEAIGV